MNQLTDTEHAVLTKLAEAWNMYLILSKEHPGQDAEFRHGIHALQRQIMARPTRRMQQAENTGHRSCSQPGCVYPAPWGSKECLLHLKP